MKKFFSLFLILVSTLIYAQNVLVITLDTTRQDSLSCYGQKDIRTENLDKLSESSYLFLNAFSPVPQTLPAHCTIFTGKYPYDHKVRDNLINYLPEEAVTLAEILKEKGYSTGAVVSAVILNHRFGLKQGFDFYEDKQDKKTSETRAKETTQRALSLLEKLKEPYFLWVHYYDPHHPYKPPEGMKAPSDYLGEVLYMDKNLKPLLDKINLSNTLIVVAGDHGESLGDHNEAEHGVLLYNPAVKIPLLLHLPGQDKKVKLNENVSLASIFPTILEYLKIDFKKDEFSPSLLKAKDIPIYLETYFPFFSFKWSPLRGIIKGNYKLIISTKEEELYDLSKDEKEMKNLIKSKTKIAENLREEFYKLTPEREFMPLQSKGHSVPDELKKQLQALGYIDGSAMDPREINSALPNPRDLADMVFFLTHEARALLNKKDADSVIKKVKEILKRDPNNFQAMGFAGEAYWLKEDYKRAKEIFEQAIKVSDKSYDLHAKLGYTLFKMDDLEEAKEEFERTLKLNEYFADVYVYYSEMYLSKKDTKNAEILLDKALKKDIYHPRIYYNFGLIKMDKKDYREAFKYFEKAYEMDSNFKEAIGNMAYCLYQTGEKEKSFILLKEGLKIDPNDFSMLKAAITVALDLNRVKEAEEYIKKLIELYPDSEEAKRMKPFFQK
ncbi:MAG: sulfatase-like hydrolase/transferase [Thermoanaerobaculia bacterium]